MSTISALTSSEKDAKLFLGSDGDGFLSNCVLPTTRYWYKRTRYRVATLFTYLSSQLILFFKLLDDRTIDHDAIIFVNTLLPFGAALYGRMTGRTVVYHIHEISVSPAILKYFLITIARWTSSLNIYVSDAHMRALPITGVPVKRVYNALDESFANKASASSYKHFCGNSFNVLMIASLRNYKGIPELLAVVETLRIQSNIHFELLVNDDQITIDRYFSKVSLPINLTIHSKTLDPSQFYSRAGLVLNLSRVDQCIETFGMTILEAMAFGIPIIAPPTGGPTELVRNGVEGYLIDSREHSNLCEKILRLAEDAQLCRKMSEACRERAKLFSLSKFEKSLTEVIIQVRENNK